MYNYTMMQIVEFLIGLFRRPIVLIGIVIALQDPEQHTNLVISVLFTNFCKYTSINVYLTVLLSTILYILIEIYKYDNSTLSRKELSSVSNSISTMISYLFIWTIVGMYYKEKYLHYATKKQLQQLMNERSVE